MYDSEIRRILHDEVLARALEDRACVVVEELGIAGNKARIDLALLNEESWTGYEIKGSRDTLRRLDRQAVVYGWIFDRMWLVCTTKHVEKALIKVPDWWGVLEVAEEGKARVVREAESNPRVEPFRIAKMMWRDEAKDAAVYLGVAQGVRSKSRNTLCQRLANTQSLETIREEATKAIRARGDWRSKHKGEPKQPAISADKHGLVVAR